ncbi:Glycogen synthase, ADP-glucose transglucosylase [hydrothermal vent metagenome]|uniref:starch synthase n=1 Tax=hydrothermal vent metagenome TaxID=652676 RepID=A0A3B1C8M0_9ZZZZ
MTKKKLTIVFVSAEAEPYSKTGGLGDVSGALSLALSESGHDVHLVTPLYKAIDRKAHAIPGKGVKIKIQVSSRQPMAEVVSIKKGRLSVHFIKQNDYYNRDGLYNTKDGDHKDNAERFIFFSRAVLEAIKALKIKPDVIHVNDWHTGLVPVYLRTLYKNDPQLAKTKTLLTVHNLGHQGIFSERDWHLTGLDWGLFSSGLLEFSGAINILKGGLLFADIITTVSDTYAKEIQTKELGCGLDSILRERADDLYGVVNGIDTNVWNPEKDKLIPKKFSVKNISGKKICKQALLKEMGLPDGNEPLLAVVSRLADQKGLDMLGEVIDDILDSGAKLVLLGSGDKKLEKMFTDLAQDKPGKVAVRIGFDEGLAHRIEAGADIFLMPSRYEPCGLNQMYSLVYGTVPLVSSTGGLNDTVESYNPATGKGNGFKFTEFTHTALKTTIQDAISLFINEPATWYKIVKRGMKENHSWAIPAAIYEKLYIKTSLNRRR